MRIFREEGIYGCAVLHPFLMKGGLVIESTIEFLTAGSFNKSRLEHHTAKSPVAYVRGIGVIHGSLIFMLVMSFEDPWEELISASASTAC